MADLAPAIKRCVNPRLMDAFIEFSQWRGPQAFAVLEESIVTQNVNPFDFFSVLLRRTVLLFSLLFPTILVRFG